MTFAMIMLWVTLRPNAANLPDPTKPSEIVMTFDECFQRGGIEFCLLVDAGPISGDRRGVCWIPPKAAQPKEEKP